MLQLEIEKDREIIAIEGGNHFPSCENRYEKQL